MRFREPFSLYKRKTSKGRSVYYYRTYDQEGKRTTAISTGKTSRAKAMEFCIDLIKRDELIPQRHKSPQDMLFKEYSKDWWIWGKCHYIKSRIARGGSISKSYADEKARILEKELLPVFGEYKLKEITTSVVEEWLIDFTDKGKANSTINHFLETLRLMMKEAQRLNKIPFNPLDQVQPLKRKAKTKGIMTLTEVGLLFSVKARRDYWDNDDAYLMNLLASCTGMRLGEVIALQCQDLKKDHLHVHRSYDRKYGLKDTKTHDQRFLPLPSFILEELDRLKDLHREGFLFSAVNGAPIYHRTVTKHLYGAMKKIGIDDETRKERNITFHSWRHFLNTTLRSHNIVDSKVQRITGHRTASMTEHYTHFQAEDFNDIRTLQENILNFNETA